jgi:hypothetical protein
MPSDKTPNEVASSPQLSTPDSDLKSLDRLIGTWKSTGGAEGTIRFEWMEGGFFLIQHVNLEQYGMKVTGIEIIGHLRPFGEGPSTEIRSRFYDAMGNTLDYVYELKKDTLMIWGGEKGSPAYYEGKFSDDGDAFAGEWHYPGGGGYKVAGKRVN